MFWCFPPGGKCEWRHLSRFVDDYNSTYEKAYTRSACLDVERRNTKEPELLLESPKDTPIVLEHKTVV